VSKREHDVVVIGAGHNGLVAAGYLARAGLRVLVLERSDRAGGAALLAATTGRLRPSVIRHLGLVSHGLGTIRPHVRAFAPGPDGRSVTLWADSGRTAEELRVRSARDAEAWPAFDRKLRALASFLAHVAATTPPDLRSPSMADALSGMRLGRAARRLGSPWHAREVLRVLPMSVADLLDESLETDVLRGAVAARAVRFSSMGPRSAGTTLTLLTDAAGNDGGAAGETAFPRGGPEVLVDALLVAAKSAGAEVRTGAEVARVRTVDGRAAGVTLASGLEIDARAVVSNADPKRLLVDLVDPGEIGPTLRWRAGNIRTPGVTGWVELTLGGLPRFPGAGSGAEAERRLAGRIVLAGGLDDLERASDTWKYGKLAERPFLEATIPSIADPSRAPGPGKHLLRAIVQWVPAGSPGGRARAAARKRLLEAAVGRLDEAAPGLAGLVEKGRALTPADLEHDLALPGGHPMHGEQGLDRFFAWRPLLGHARYRIALEGLYLCGAGAHPGGGVTGWPGANCAREVQADLRRRRARH
jgi:phytoene dehydrogenase-like protein